MDATPSMWNGRRVLVTGCTGFLGGAVARELLSRGAAVVGLVRDRSRAAELVSEIASGQLHIVHGIVEDSPRLHSTMAIHEVSAVFHLVESERGTAAVLRAAALHDPLVPIVMARPAQGLRIASEAAPPTGRVGIARFGEVFGPRDRRLDRIVPRTVTALLTKQPATLSNDRQRDFVFVRDAARACLALAEAVSQAGHSLDHAFQSGWECTDRTMMEYVTRQLAGQVDEMRPAQCDNPLGWRAETALNDALAETIEWYRQHMLANPADTSLPARRAA